MATIDERCFGHDPAETQLTVLRFTLNQFEKRWMKLKKENKELRDKIEKLEVERVK
jgi:hypothetical protein